jgi:signal transduction histidine kinase
MGERVKLIGGVFTIESSPGNGTTIFARIPLVSHASPADNQPHEKGKAPHPAGG